MSDVEEDMVGSRELHLGVDGAGHDVARRERQARVILVHELIAVDVAEHGSITAHRLCNEKRRAVAGVIERGRVELDELHVADGALGAVDHSDAVAGRYERIGRGAVDGADAPCGHYGDTGEESIDLAGCLVEDVGSVTGYVGSTPGHDHTEVVLRNDLDSEAVGEDVDVAVGEDSLHKTLLDLGSGVVGMVQDSEFGVSPLAMEVERSVILLVEVDAPRDQLADLVGSVTYHLLDGSGVGEPVAGHHSVVYVLVEVVDLEVCHRRHTALSEIRICLVECGFADYRYLMAASCGLEGERHSGDAGTDDQIVVSECHFLIITINLQI